MFDYEMDMEKSLEDHKLIAIVKATGLGITEFMLRWTEWRILVDPKLRDSQVVILVGQSIRKAAELIARMKEHLGIQLEGSAYRFDLNGCQVEAYPSMNIHAVRSLTNPKIILIDEGAFFGMLNDEIARTVAERYIAKSDPHIIIFSTPYLPNGMFYNLMQEEPSNYHKIYLPYTKGVGKIYSNEDIAKAKKTKSFEMEYNLRWGFGAGDIYDLDILGECSKQRYGLEFTEESDSVLALDPAYGSSKFGIVGMAYDGKIIKVTLAEELNKTSDSQALQEIDAIIRQYRYANLFIDSAYPGLYKEFQEKVSCTSVNFRIEGQDLIHNGSNKVANKEIIIHPKFEELLKQLRSAKRNDRGQLDKKSASLDLVDAFNMSLWYFKKGGGSIVEV